VYAVTLLGGSFSGSESGLGVDVGPGANFAVPFSAGGGVTLGANPLNVVTNARSDLSMSQVGVRGKMGVNFPTVQPASGGAKPVPIPWSTIVTPWVSTSFTHTRIDQNFAASIPGFARDFGYNTDVNVNSFGLGIGTDIRMLLHRSRASDVNLIAGGGVDLRLTDLDGTDRTFFTGFPDSSALLGDSRTSAAFDARVGLEVRSGASNALTSLFHINFFYKREPSGVVVNRPSLTPAAAQILDVDAFGGSAGFTFWFK
jgi:hypothetical protein